jgi:hypothetical protein
MQGSIALSYLRRLYRLTSSSFLKAITVYYYAYNTRKLSYISDII